MHEVAGPGRAPAQAHVARRKLYGTVGDELNHGMAIEVALTGTCNMRRFPGSSIGKSFGNLASPRADGERRPFHACVACFRISPSRLAMACQSCGPLTELACKSSFRVRPCIKMLPFSSRPSLVLFFKVTWHGLCLGPAFVVTGTSLG